MQQQHPVILFDGICNFCNGAVNFIIKLDKKKIFQFAALQSSSGQKLLQEYQLSAANFDSFVFIDNHEVYQKSKAAFKVISYLPWYIKWTKVFGLLPVSLTDAVYTFIAQNRYKWFGKKAQCMLPAPDIVNRFL